MLCYTTCICTSSINVTMFHSHSVLYTGVKQKPQSGIREVDPKTQPNQKFFGPIIPGIPNGVQIQISIQFLKQFPNCKILWKAVNFLFVETRLRIGSNEFVIFFFKSQDIQLFLFVPEFFGPKSLRFFKLRHGRDFGLQPDRDLWC